MEENVFPKFIEVDYESGNYDPKYTAEILDKMRIPDKISIEQSIEIRESKIENSQLNNILTPIKEKMQYMYVPDRIYVTSIDNQNFLDDEISNKKEINNLNEKNLSENNLNNSYKIFEQPFQRHKIKNLNFKDDYQLIKKHIKSLNRRVFILEQEIKNKFHRDIILYALGFLYITVKSLYWLKKG